jgi:hypothetical protein
MTVPEPPGRPPAARKLAARQAREAERLRENLRRRKEQSRARAEGGEGADAAGEEPSLASSSESGKE